MLKWLPRHQDSGSGPGRDWVARSSGRPAGEHGDHRLASRDDDPDDRMEDAVGDGHDGKGHDGRGHDGKGHDDDYGLGATGTGIGAMSGWTGFTPPHVSAVRSSYTG
jgi:hypothetical protein